MSTEKIISKNPPQDNEPYREALETQAETKGMHQPWMDRLGEGGGAGG